MAKGRQRHGRSFCPLPPRSSSSCPEPHGPFALAQGWAGRAAYVCSMWQEEAGPKNIWLSVGTHSHRCAEGTLVTVPVHLAGRGTAVPPTWKQLAAGGWQSPSQPLSEQSCVPGSHSGWQDRFVHQCWYTENSRAHRPSESLPTSCPQDSLAVIFRANTRELSNLLLVSSSAKYR